jgi:hypothetical protein
MTRDEILALADLLARATNGPWRTAKNDPCRVLDSAGTVRVCHAFSSVMRDEIDEANAALIAKTPAMAETLIAMQAELDAERAAREKEDKIPAWHAAHAMDMLDAFRALGVRMAHGVSDDPEIVLGPCSLADGRRIFCSMSIGDGGWSGHFIFKDHGLPNLSFDGSWDIPDEVRSAIRTLSGEMTDERNEK